MRYCRFEYQNHPHFGRVEPHAGADHITHRLLDSPQQVSNAQQARSERIDPIALSNAPLLAPVQPSKIV